MASQQQLKEANYAARGEHVEDIGDIKTCALLACDYSKILVDEKTGEEYRYCTKLQIPVGYYDSCKYHSEDRMLSYLQAFADTAKKKGTVHPIQQVQDSYSQSEQVRKSARWPYIVFGILMLLIYFWLK